MKYWFIAIMIATLFLTACTIEQGPTCRDGIQNADETGVDCGGTYCKPCYEVMPVAQCAAEKANLIAECPVPIAEPTPEPEPAPEPEFPFDEYGCYDSDGGSYKFVMGFAVHTDGRRVNDTCSSDYNLQEAYCDFGHAPTSKILRCNYKCEDDVCVALTPDNSDCYDYDGDDQDVADHTILADGTEKWDYCIDNNTVREYLCNSFDQSILKDYTCINSTCVGGACQ